jgi:peptidoglycan/LPS O-acetylase OafA/YrhL
VNEGAPSALADQRRTIGAVPLQFPALTGLRFVLALWVVLHHLTGRGAMLEPLAQMLPLPVDRIVRAGYLAVGSFFVLSGFVLTRSYGAKRWNLRNLGRYGMGRFARIYPVYALSLILIAPFMLTTRLPGKAALIADYGLLLQGWTGILPVNWNTPAWSLSCEVFFYLCFPVAIVLAPRTGWLKVLAYGMLACFLTAICRAAGVPEVWKPILHFSDFAMGIAAARAYELSGPFRRRLAGRGHWLYLPAIGISAAVIAYPELLRGLMELNAPLRPLNALMLIGFATGGGFAARALSSRTAILLGQASYSVYILHIPLLWWYGWVLPSHSGIVTRGIVALIYVGITVTVSVAVYRFLEEPANRRLRAWLG